MEVLRVKYIFNRFGELCLIYFNFDETYYGKYSFYSNRIVRRYIGEVPDNADSEVLEYLKSVGLKVKD